MAGCGSCAARARARAAAQAAGNIKYRWMSEDGMQEKDYDTEYEAKAKVAFKGGTYRPVQV
jgi:hypothetical protein